MTLAPWTRCPYGWLNPERTAFAERGARMSDGGTAWLIWYLIDDSEITVDEYGAYQSANGMPARTLAEITGWTQSMADSVRPSGWWAHRNDAGSLNEAKLTAESVLVRGGSKP